MTVCIGIPTHRHPLGSHCGVLLQNGMIRAVRLIKFELVKLIDHLLDLVLQSLHPYN